MKSGIIIQGMKEIRNVEDECRALVQSTGRAISGFERLGIQFGEMILCEGAVQARRWFDYLLNIYI